MDIRTKLEILSDAAKYDAACTSSGLDRSGKKGQLGSSAAAGICHSFSADGRCISLLKVLFTNVCTCDCSYCVNRKSNDIPRASFTPRELADLTIGFYRRNYIEGLFLSSGVIRNPDYTMEQLIETLRILREEEGFRGYIHVKSIPGASQDLIEVLGSYADRMSINIELPSQDSLSLHAPQKAKTDIIKPMGLIRDGILQSADDMKLARRNYLSANVRRFAPAGQSTQMIIGASPETDQHILTLTSALYKQFSLKRVFYSAYLPVNDDPRLPALNTDVPLTREHRLYQADWLLRFYGFEADELLSPESPDLELGIDPKASWALRNIHLFPMEVNKASYEELLRIPGLGVKTAKRIVRARMRHRLSFDDLKTLGLSLKRAGWFITCNGRMADGFDLNPDLARLKLEDSTKKTGAGRKGKRGMVDGQLSLFGAGVPSATDVFAAKGHRDVLLEAARNQRLQAKIVIPDGLPQAIPMLKAVG